jgi:predicted kinase
MRIAIPDFCLVALIGASGSGKSTFARRHFKPTEVISSDACRGMVEDDENSLDATADAFALLHVIAETRLKRRKIVVIDATNVRQEDRAQLVRIAKKFHALAVAILLNPGEDICYERNKARPDRQYGPHVVRNHMAEPVRPLGSSGDGLSLQHADDDVLDLSLVIGKRIVEVGAGRPITIEEGSAAAALEVMTRFAIHPKWLIYLQPTMSPPATTARDGLLEHPDEAFAYYRDEGVGAVVVEEKHMGSRALIVLCRDEAAARDRFGVTTGETGAIYTRTGRAFFQERSTTEAVLARVRAAMTEVGFWERHSTGWALLDAEIMPWSAKASRLAHQRK